MRLALPIAGILHLGLWLLVLTPIQRDFPSDRVFWVEPRTGERARPIAVARSSKSNLSVAQSVNEISAKGPTAERTGHLATVEDIIGMGNSPPQYPFVALQRGWEGRVELKLRIHGGSGLVTPEVDLVASSGYPILDQAALEWAKGCRIPVQSARIDLTVPIEYRLDN